MYIIVERKQHILDQAARVSINPSRLVAAIVKFDDSHGCLLAGNWAIKLVSRTGNVVGYCVGDGRTWRTVLGPGMTPRAGSKVYTIVM